MRASPLYSVGPTLRPQLLETFCDYSLWSSAITFCISLLCAVYHLCSLPMTSSHRSFLPRLLEVPPLVVKYRLLGRQLPLSGAGFCLCSLTKTLLRNSMLLTEMCSLLLRTMPSSLRCLTTRRSDGSRSRQIQLTRDWFLAVSSPSFPFVLITPSRAGSFLFRPLGDVVEACPILFPRQLPQCVLRKGFFHLPDQVVVLLNIVGLFFLFRRTALTSPVTFLPLTGSYVS